MPLVPVSIESLPPRRPGQRGRDLGHISSGTGVLWGYRCLGDRVKGLVCRESAPIGLTKARATANARRHVAVKLTHRVELQAITTQMVYGPDAR